jgi:glycerophosphoryl diester phosphodiesterase
MLLAKLEAHGYRDEQSPAFVQCFDAAELRRIRTELGCRLKLVQLVGPENEYAALLDEDGLRGVAGYADALGAAYEQLIACGETPSAPPRPAQLAATARRAGLRLHPYTFRRDVLPPFAASLERLLELFFVTVRVDGVFCDHPDVAVRVRDAVFGRASAAGRERPSAARRRSAETRD